MRNHPDEEPCNRRAEEKEGDNVLCGCLSVRACFTVESGSKNLVCLTQELLGYEEKKNLPSLYMS